MTLLYLLLVLAGLVYVNARLWMHVNSNRDIRLPPRRVYDDLGDRLWRRRCHVNHWREVDE